MASDLQPPQQISGRSRHSFHGCLERLSIVGGRPVKTRHLPHVLHRRRPNLILSSLRRHRRSQRLDTPTHTGSITRRCDNPGTIEGTPLLWYAFGKYDAYDLWEAPDNISMAAVAMAIVGGGALSKFETTVLLTVEETMDAMQRVSSIRYRPRVPDITGQGRHRDFGIAMTPT